MTAADAQINKHYLELKVFRGDHAVPDAIAGIVQVEPHTTFRDVDCYYRRSWALIVRSVVVLSRTTYSEGGGDGGNGGNGGGGRRVA